MVINSKFSFNRDCRARNELLDLMTGLLLPSSLKVYREMIESDECDGSVNFNIFTPKGRFIFQF